MAVVLVDSLNIMFIEFHIACSKLHEEGKILDKENFPFYAHLLFNKINSLFATYGKLIFCFEGKNSIGWRRSIYPEYKANRKDAQDNEEFKIVKNFIPKFHEVLNYYPCKQIEVENSEADDVIFSLSKKYKDDKVIIVSTDGDFVQIINLFGENVEVYNPVKRIFAKKNEHLIEEKAICGDTSDNIPGLFRVGPKTFEKMIASPIEWNKVMSKGNNKTIFENFKKIVDLREFPEDISKQIVDKESQTEYNSFQPENIELFFWELRLKDQLKRWTSTIEEIRRAI
jgi:5'-3' exonuclease